MAHRFLENLTVKPYIGALVYAGVHNGHMGMGRPVGAECPPQAQTSIITHPSIRKVTRIMKFNLIQASTYIKKFNFAINILIT